MSKRIFIDGNINSELCIIATDGQEVNYFDYSDELISSKKNNIYLGTVSRVEPSLQAAFVDFGANRNGFLPLTEIHPDYFKIPSADQEDVKKLYDQLTIDDNENDDVIGASRSTVVNTLVNNIGSITITGTIINYNTPVDNNGNIVG